MTPRLWAVVPAAGKGTGDDPYSYSCQCRVTGCAHVRAVKSIRTAAGIKLPPAQREVVALIDVLIDGKFEQAQADANFVLIEGGQIAEVQATAEGATYDEEGLLRLLRLARIGCNAIFAAQDKAVGK